MEISDFSHVSRSTAGNKKIKHVNKMEGDHEHGEVSDSKGPVIKEGLLEEV